MTEPVPAQLNTLLEDSTTYGWETRVLGTFLKDVLEHIEPEGPGHSALYSLAKSIYYSAPEIAGHRIKDAADIVNRHFVNHACEETVIRPAWDRMIAQLKAGAPEGDT